jgi:hypothetical protein
VTPAERYRLNHPDEVREQQKVYRGRNRLAVNGRRRKWSKKNAESVRASQLRARYGIEPEDYDSLLTKQNGVCAVCEKSQSNTRYKYLCVDHDHTTGVVRGLLCHNCNRALGLLKDNPRAVEKLLTYLR